MVTYLITGGAGFIGSNFIHYLYETYGEEVQIINLDLLTYAGNLKNLELVLNRYNYHFIKGDVCDKEVVSKIMSSYDIDYIVHFAAETHVDRSIEDSNKFVHTNVFGTLNLLNCSKDKWFKNDKLREGKKFVYVSTDEVYGELGCEGYFREDTPIAPRNPYSASKAGGELLAKAYYDTYHFPVIRTRCTNNYGQYQFPEKLIPLYIYNCIHNKKLPVYGDGHAIRDWLHVKDHCRALDCVLKGGKLGEVYNIGSNNEKTTLEIAEIIMKMVGDKLNHEIPKDNIVFNTDRKGHDKRYAIDATKIREELHWSPEIEFSLGIEETIEWYISNSDYLDKIFSKEYMEYYDIM